MPSSTGNLPIDDFSWSLESLSKVNECFLRMKKESNIPILYIGICSFKTHLVPMVDEKEEWEKSGRTKWNVPLIIQNFSEPYRSRVISELDSMTDHLYYLSGCQDGLSYCVDCLYDYQKYFSTSSKSFYTKKKILLTCKFTRT